MDSYAQTSEGSTSSTVLSPPLSPRMKKKSRLHSKVVSSSGILAGPANFSDIYSSTQFEKTRAIPPLQNQSGTRNTSEEPVGSHISARNFDFPSSLTAKPTPDFYQICDTNSENIAQCTGNPSPVSAYIHDEFVYYEFSENDDCDDEKSSNQKSLESNLNEDGILLNSSTEVNGLIKEQSYSPENISHGTEATFPIKTSESFTLSNFKKNLGTLNSLQPAPTADNIESLESNLLKSRSSIPVLGATKEKFHDCTQPDRLHSKKYRFKFKKLTPTETLERYLSNTESLSYEELYHRTANVALLMTKLQEEARMIDREISDFEIAKKSDQQIAMEEAKLEKELTQKKDDAIFGMLLRKYGSFARSSVDEWTEFQENFYENYPDENPKHYRLVLLLRNPQYINDFHKRTAARERAILRAKTSKLANTIDSPPSKVEQKALEESDRKKRKPAIDPLVFEDRKMADVYGLTYKIGEAYIGNQTLRDQSGFLKAENSTNSLDENSRPRRSRCKRGNHDTDQSDHTPVVSDAEETIPMKRTRSSRAFYDSTTSRAASRTAPSSRESTPGIGSKTFASGKRVGRPPGSKTQVKLPSKLKSVQAAGEVANGSEENESDIPVVKRQKKSPCPPDIVIQEYDQALERNIGERQSEGSRNCNENHLDEKIAKIVPETLPKKKCKVRKSSKSPTQKVIKNSEDQKVNLRRRTTTARKKKPDPEFDPDILPSTEVSLIMSLG